MKDILVNTPPTFTPWSPSDFDASLEFTRKGQEREEGKSDDDVSIEVKPNLETNADLRLGIYRR